MSESHAILRRLVEALEAKAQAANQEEEDVASDELIEALGDLERDAAKMAELLRRLLPFVPVDV